LPELFGIGVVEASLSKWWNLFMAAMKRMAGNQELFLAHEHLPFLPLDKLLFYLL
jgi:hypothetical protein